MGMILKWIMRMRLRQLIKHKAMMKAKYKECFSIKPYKDFGVSDWRVTIFIRGEMLIVERKIDHLMGRLKDES